METIHNVGAVFTAYTELTREGRAEFAAMQAGFHAYEATARPTNEKRQTRKRKAKAAAITPQPAQ
jgi:hypothetical protein